MACAMYKFGKASGRTEYVRFANDMAYLVAHSRRMTCNNAPSFDVYSSRVFAADDQWWYSFEHAFDAYALIQLIAQGYSNTPEWIVQMNSSIVALADALYGLPSSSVSWRNGETPFYHMLGGACYNNSWTYNSMQPPATDTQTWKYLTSLPDGGSDHIRRTKNSLTFVTQKTFAEDVYHAESYWGVTFTALPGSDGVRTIQLENTGAAFIAACKYRLEAGDSDADADQKHHDILTMGVKIGRSLHRLLQRQRRTNAAGIPASFREAPQDLKADPLNTGLTWSYFDWPHGASTAYTAMALEIMVHGASEDAIALYNPYSSYASYPNTRNALQNKLLRDNAAAPMPDATCAVVPYDDLIATHVYDVDRSSTTPQGTLAALLGTMSGSEYEATQNKASLVFLQKLSTERGEFVPFFGGHSNRGGFSALQRKAEAFYKRLFIMNHPYSYLDFMSVLGKDYLALSDVEQVKHLAHAVFHPAFRACDERVQTAALLVAIQTMGEERISALPVRPRGACADGFITYSQCRDTAYAKSRAPYGWWPGVETRSELCDCPDEALRSLINWEDASAVQQSGFVNQLSGPSDMASGCRHHLRFGRYGWCDNSRRLATWQYDDPGAYSMY